MDTITQAPALPAVRPAGFWIRFVASFIDMIIVTLLTAPFVAVQLWFSRGSGENPLENIQGTVITTLLFWTFASAIKFFYYAAFYQSKGATLGKKAMNVKVVRLTDGGFLTYRE